MAATTLSSRTKPSPSAPADIEQARTVPAPDPDVTPGEKAVYRADWYCLLFWLSGLGILFAMQLLDGLSRLFRLL